VTRVKIFGLLASLGLVCLACEHVGPLAVVRHHNYVFEFGDYALEVDPDDGGRTVALSVAGHSAIVSRNESPEAYGSSLWPSPQSDWSWPPPPSFDKLPWHARVDGAALVLDSATDPKLGLSATERISAEPERAAFRFELTLHNRGAQPRRVAPWQNTRMRPSGLSFFPSPDAMQSDAKQQITPQNGLIWFTHDPHARTDGEKFFDDGAEGWLAQLDGDVLLVKAFPDVPKAAQAPKEAEIELYADGAGRFVEVEQQGPYVEILPGQSSSWVVHWATRRLPANVGRTAFDPTLAAFARSVANAIRKD
jgi:hypothetical protein